MRVYDKPYEIYRVKAGGVTTAPEPILMYNESWLAIVQRN
jgi:hypothetical protein